ncbi:MAG: MerR family transcriptional regulator [Cellulomonadaceae bacterium]|jgi:MerR family transcriptional regulator/heat shock protein HspR|nr:MerR family transcriptional regulator [Cellulomonadaceae bacterium]
MSTIDEAPLLTVTQAALAAGMHAQTLRQYDRLGLVVPARTRGGGRRYSLRDVEALRQVQYLAQTEGINLAGIKRILALEDQVDGLRKQVARLLAEQSRLDAAQNRVFAAGTSGDVVAVPRGRRVTHSGGAVVLWRPRA